MTGGAAGIGAATSSALARARAHVTLAVRDTGSAQMALTGFCAGAEHFDIAYLDLLDLRSIEKFVSAWNGPLDGLVANEGLCCRTSGTPAQGGRPSSRRTTSVTSRWPKGCAPASPEAAVGSYWLPPALTSMHRSSSTISTSATGSTCPCWAMASRRLRTCSSPSRQGDAGRMTESASTLLARHGGHRPPEVYRHG